MENSESQQVLLNLSQLLTAIRENPGLSEAFQSPSAPGLMLNLLSGHANVGANEVEVVLSELHGTAVRRSETGQRAVDKVLENDLLLELIFSHCSFDSLTACRQVSKRWRDFSIKAWRKEAVLWLTDEEIYVKPHQMRLSKLNKIIETVKAGGNDIHQLLEKPFASYNLHWCFQNGRLRIEDSAPYRTFIEQFESHTTYLDLGRAAAESPSALVTLLFSEFHHLTHLKLSNAYLHGGHAAEDFLDAIPNENVRVLEIEDILFTSTFSWLEFLRRLPHLRKIKLAFAPDEDEADGGENLSKGQMQDALEAMGSLRAESEDILNLKELDLLRIHSNPLRRVESETAALLKLCKFSLERFSFDLGRKTKPSCIRDLLVPFSTSLKFLHLSRGVCQYEFLDSSSETSLQKMREMVADIRIRLERLEELRLLNGPCWGVHLLSYLDAPLLKKLVFEFDISFFKEMYYGVIRRFDRVFHETEVMYTFLKHRAFPNLVTFEYEHSWNLLGSRDVHALGKAMPYLENLAMPLSAETLKDVCRLWPGLKSLDVRKCEGDFPEIDDEAMTGFTGVKVGSALPPNITDLKELTDLTISCERTLKRKDVKFTDHSVTHGFLKLPRLHYLSIAFKQISEKAKTALESHVNYVHYQSLEK